LKKRWVSDDEFIRGNIPMTKFEVRIAAIAAMKIEKEDVLLDIGAGTGSISVEAALHGALVYAVERENEGIELIRQNASKFNAKVDIIKALAPDGLESVHGFNKCFIGGSGGRLREIFDYVNNNMAPGGITAANFITLKNLNEFLNLLEEYDYRDLETKLLQVSHMEKSGLLKAHNPVFIVRGRKP